MTTFRTLAPRLLAGFSTAALLAAFGLFASSRPVHSTGGPIPVTVTNTVQSRDVDNPARQPFAIRVYPNVNTGATFTVPAGKRLVIQYVDALSFGSTTAEDVAIYSTVSGIGAGQIIPFTVTNHGSVYANAATTMYADPGTTVSVFIDDADQADIAGMNVDITGYYVNVP